MVYRPNVDEQLCFVLMPFREPFNGYYTKIITPAARELGLQALRADNIYGNGVVIREIWDQIWFARVVVADVTDKNPNVNYELGLCHALGVPTILISRRKEDVPFDYQHRRYILYNTDEVGWDKTLQENLRKTLETVLSGGESDVDLIWPYDTRKASTIAVASLLSTENPRDLVVQGVQSVGIRIAKAIGPAGKYFSLSLNNTEPLPYRKGASIATGTRANNPLEARGVSLIQEAAEEVNHLVGDGTKICILLARSMIELGNEELKKGFLPRELIRGMKKAIDLVVTQLAEEAKPVGRDQLMQVATTAATDPEIGQLITAAMERVGKDGVITVEDSTTDLTTLEVVEGMQFDRGYLSEQFITDHTRGEVVLENPYVLIHERRISSMRDILPILEQIAQANESLLVIAEDVEGEALATLVVNKLRGTVKVAAVKAPGFGDRRRAMMDDITVLTGAKILDADLGMNLEHVKLADLGRAKSVIINREFTTIVEGVGQQSEIELRVKTLRMQMEEAVTSYERERLAERLARLVSGVSVIRVGGIPRIDAFDKKQRTVSAMYSARSAVEEGWVLGGGVTLFHIADSVKKLVGNDDAESAGIATVSKALEDPMKCLIENAKASPTQVMHEVSQQENATLGFNVDNKRVEDLVQAGILDSKKMLRVALEVAFAHAKFLLETEDWDLNETKPA